MRIEHIGDATLYLGDCLDILPNLQADACLTDPPYGCGVKYGEAYNDSRSDYWPWFKERLQIIRSVCPLVAFTHRVPALKHLTDWDWCGVWNKPGSFGSRLGNSFVLPHWEPLFLYGIYKCGVRSEYLADVLTHNPQPANAGHNGMGREKWSKDQNENHPTPKPIALIMQLVKVLAAPSATILDPFMGSGTTGVACAKLGRKFIGVEIEERYFNIACRRIEQAYAQDDMFLEPPKKVKQEAFL